MLVVIQKECSDPIEVVISRKVCAQIFTKEKMSLLNLTKI